MTAINKPDPGRNELVASGLFFLAACFFGAAGYWWACAGAFGISVFFLLQNIIKPDEDEY